MTAYLHLTRLQHQFCPWQRGGVLSTCTCSLCHRAGTHSLSSFVPVSHLTQACIQIPYLYRKRIAMRFFFSHHVTRQLTNHVWLRDISNPASFLPITRIELHSICVVKPKGTCTQHLSSPLNLLHLLFITSRFLNFGIGVTV